MVRVWPWSGTEYIRQTGSWLSSAAETTVPRPWRLLSPCHKVDQRPDPEQQGARKRGNRPWAETKELRAESFVSGPTFVEELGN